MPFKADLPICQVSETQLHAHLSLEPSHSFPSLSLLLWLTLDAWRMAAWGCGSQRLSNCTKLRSLLYHSHPSEPLGRQLLGLSSMREGPGDSVGVMADP